MKFRLIKKSGNEKSRWNILNKIGLFIVLLALLNFSVTIIEKLLTKNLRISWEILIDEEENIKDGTDIEESFSTIQDFFTINIKNNWDKIYVWESFDLEIVAKDLDYSDTLLVFSESDRYAEFSNDFDEGAIEYKKNEKDTFLIEDGISFFQSGLQDISVYSLEDETENFAWKVEVMVYDKNEESSSISDKKEATDNSKNDTSNNSKKGDNYWEVCKVDADCFCNTDSAWLEWCYYKSWQSDICEGNICKRGFRK